MGKFFENFTKVVCIAKLMATIFLTILLSQISLMIDTKYPVDGVLILSSFFQTLQFKVKSVNFIVIYVIRSFDPLQTNVIIFGFLVPKTLQWCIRRE